MDFRKELKSHTGLAKRKKKSCKKLELVRKEFKKSGCFDDEKIMIFCAGSLARLEFGKKSDLDLFVTAEEVFQPNRLEEYTLYSDLIRLNKKLNFPTFSNDGEYLKVHSLKKLKDNTGSRKDDSDNSFTVRILLILESQYITNKDKYDGHLSKILKHYFRDERGKKNFHPTFLLNDLLRYWRTLCLNYEEIRSLNKPWRKKNINLKFSRMLTVFSTVLLLITNQNTFATQKEYFKYSPLERLAVGLDSLKAELLFEEWKEILDIYEEFLTWKEKDNDYIEKYFRANNQKNRMDDYANKFSDYLYKALSHEQIPRDYRKYLVL